MSITNLPALPSPSSEYVQACRTAAAEYRKSVFAYVNAEGLWESTIHFDMVPFNSAYLNFTPHGRVYPIGPA